jgi:hypothetical protein
MLIVVKHVDVFIFEIESHATKNQFYYCFNFNTLTLPDFAYRMFDIDSDFSLVSESSNLRETVSFENK